MFFQASYELEVEFVFMQLVFKISERVNLFVSNVELPSPYV